MTLLDAALTLPLDVVQRRIVSAKSPYQSLIGNTQIVRGISSYIMCSRSALTSKLRQRIYGFKKEDKEIRRDLSTRAFRKGKNKEAD